MGVSPMYTRKKRPKSRPEWPCYSRARCPCYDTAAFFDGLLGITMRTRSALHGAAAGYRWRLALDAARGRELPSRQTKEVAIGQAEKLRRETGQDALCEPVRLVGELTRLLGERVGQDRLGGRPRLTGQSVSLAKRIGRLTGPRQRATLVGIWRLDDEPYDRSLVIVVRPKQKEFPNARQVLRDGMSGDLGVRTSP